MSIFSKAADAIRNIGYARHTLRSRKTGGMCALGAIGHAMGLDNELLSERPVLCADGLSHPAEVIRLRDLLDETGWGDTSNRDPCTTVYCWSDHTDGEHVGDVLFVLGEGDEDKARQMLKDRWGDNR